MPAHATEQSGATSARAAGTASERDDPAGPTAKPSEPSTRQAAKPTGRGESGSAVPDSDSAAVRAQGIRKAESPPSALTGAEKEVAKAATGKTTESSRPDRLVGSEAEATEAGKAAE